MRLQSWIVVGFAGMIAAACGGSVSLGEIPSGSTGTTSDGGGGDGGGTGTDSGVTECSNKADCGAQPKNAAIMCSDGSLGGNTGRCLKTATGCAWENRVCPPDACFDANAALAAGYKKCASAADCTVVPYQINCCGSMHAAGVNITSKAAVDKCAQDRAAAFPLCDCATNAPLADDGSTDSTFSGIAPAVTCNAQNQCETSFKGEVCGKVICKPGATCCSGVPLSMPTCVDSGACPVSQRKHKKDITYLSEADRQRLNDELLHFPLATYRYKSESDADREHLGFIIDDVVPSPAVQASGERVDMYGYQTMAVAALQVQAREIAALRSEMAALKATCGASAKRR
jgi:hypothetical protein